MAQAANHCCPNQFACISPTPAKTDYIFLITLKHTKYRLFMSNYEFFERIKIFYHDPFFLSPCLSDFPKTGEFSAFWPLLLLLRQPSFLICSLADANFILVVFSDLKCLRRRNIVLDEPRMFSLIIWNDACSF